MSGLKIAFTNFWQGFSLQTGLIKLLLDEALGDYSVVARPEEADVVLMSVFSPPPVPAAFRERAIVVLWENVRPEYTFCAFSFSSDFDTYGGRNCRLPYWYNELKWPRLIPTQSRPGAENHGFEAPLDIDVLMQPRPDWATIRSHQHFCCFVASNYEPHRMLAIDYLKEVGPVHVYGNVVKRPLRASKFTVLPQYRFNLCFENGLFPGYYTEKPLQAWAGGCIPLYYADRWFREDFNPGAMVNRAEFRTIADFARHVGEIDKSPALFDAIAAEPLLIRRPSLDEPVEFLARAARKIVDSAPRRLFPARG